jgi:hypothetical protein
MEAMLDAMVARHPDSTRFEVERVDATITPEEFAVKYYLPQLPVVVAGLARHWPAVRLWSPEYLFENLKGSAIEREYYFDLAADHRLAGDCEEPLLFKHVKGRRSVITRAQSVRLWVSRKGTHTRWHYDGNSLQVFNVQVRGRKRFSLISPHTPLTCFGFSYGAHAGYTNVFDIDAPTRFAVCEISSGDMLFIPQHWFHYVVSLEDVNLNINWVWTDTELLKSADTRTAKRERERIAVLYALATWLRRLGYSTSLLESLDTYGGAPDFALARELYNSVSSLAIAKRWLLEFSRGLADRRCKRENKRRELDLNEGVPRSAYDYLHKAEIPSSFR